MKIDLVITELYPGGAERAMTDLAIGFHERGDLVRVTSLAPLPPPPKNVLVDRLRASEIDVQSVNLHGPLSLWTASRRLSERLRSGKADVVQSFLFHANVITSWSLGTSQQGSQALHVAGIRVAEPSRFRTFLESSRCRRMAAAVCVSRGVEAFVKRTWKPAPNFKLLSIPNGLNSEQVHRLTSSQPYDWTQLGLSPEKPVSLFVGRLHPQKGIDWFLEFAPRLLARFPDLQWVFVGDGPLRELLQTTIKKLRTDQWVWLPWQSDTTPLFRAADLVFLPSRFEGMPNVVLEAMAAGKPVLSTNVEGVEELLGDDVSVQSFPVEDAQSMMQRLETLQDQQLRIALGERNRKRSLAEFSIEHAIDRYRALYSDLMSSPAQ